MDMLAKELDEREQTNAFVDALIAEGKVDIDNDNNLFIVDWKVCTF